MSCYLYLLTLPKIDFCQSAVDKKEQTYERKTQTA